MKPIILQIGPNHVLLKEDQNRLLKNTDQESRMIYYAEESSATQVFAQCYQSALFGAGVTVILRDTGRVKDKSLKDTYRDALIHYLDDPNTDNTLIVEWEKPPKKLLDAVNASKHAEIREYKRLYRESDIKAYIKAALSQKGLSTDNDVIELLMNLSNNDQEQLSAYIVLLAEQKTQKGEISFEEAKNVLARAHNLSVFDLTEAILAKDTAKALSALEDLKLAGESVIAINNMIFRTARLMWGVLTSAGQSGLHQTLGCSPYEIKKLSRFKTRVNLKYLSRLFQTVAGVEVKSKSMAQEFAFLEWECFILTMRDTA